MHADHPLPEHAQLVQIADGRGPVVLQRLRSLVLAFRHVDVERRVGGLSDLEAGADHPGGGPVRAVRGRLHADERIATILRDQVPGAPRRLGRLFSIPRGRTLPIVHGPGQHEPDADVARGLDHRLGIVVALVLEIEEVHARGDAVEEHLGEGEGRAEIDAAAVETRRVGVEHAIAPGHEVEVVAEPAQERLEGVTVRVDGAGEERFPREPRDVRGRRVRGRAWAHVRDPTVSHRDDLVAEPTTLHNDDVGQESHQDGDSSSARIPRPARRECGSRTRGDRRPAAPLPCGRSRPAGDGR